MYERLSRRTHLSGQAFGASIKTSVNITASTTSGQIVAVQNPQKTYVFARDVLVHVKTGSTAACGLDIGTASTNTASDNLIDGISVNAVQNTVYDNITDHGSNGKTRQYVPYGGWFTVTVDSGDANGLVADIEFKYDLPTGGAPVPPGYG